MAFFSGRRLTKYDIVTVTGWVLAPALFSQSFRTGNVTLLLRSKLRPARSLQSLVRRGDICERALVQRHEVV